MDFALIATNAPGRFLLSHCVAIFGISSAYGDEQTSSSRIFRGKSSSALTVCHARQVSKARLISLCPEYGPAEKNRLWGKCGGRNFA